MDSGEPYLPVGDLPYVVRRDWGAVIGPAVLLGGPITLFVGYGVGLVAGAVVGVVGLVALAAEVISTARSDDEGGVVFVVDEDGIYFGDAPREVIPWPMVVTVMMSETEPLGDHAGGRSFWVRVGVPGDSVVEDGRIRRGDFYPDFAAMSDALDRHAPPSVVVHRYYR